LLCGPGGLRPGLRSGLLCGSRVLRLRRRLRPLPSLLAERAERLLPPRLRFELLRPGLLCGPRGLRSGLRPGLLCSAFVLWSVLRLRRRLRTLPSPLAERLMRRPAWLLRRFA
jgi:hypothetical protein